MRRWEEDVTVRDLQLQRLKLEPGLCLWCGYDLSGLGTDAVCPECGKPREVEKALPRCPEEKLLRHAPLAWRRRVVLGVRMLDWAGWLVCGVAVSMASWLLLMGVLIDVFEKADTGNWVIVPVVAGMAMAVGAGVFSVAGSWLVTTPPLQGGISLRARRTLRWSAVMLGALQCAWIATGLLKVPVADVVFQSASHIANILAALWGWSLLRNFARLEWHTSRWSHRRTTAYAKARSQFGGVLVLIAIGSVLLWWSESRYGATAGPKGLAHNPEDHGSTYGLFVVFLVWVLWAFSVRSIVPAVRGEHRVGTELGRAV